MDEQSVKVSYPAASEQIPGSREIDTSTKATVQLHVDHAHEMKAIAETTVPTNVSYLDNMTNPDEDQPVVPDIVTPNIEKSDKPEVVRNRGEEDHEHNPSPSLRLHRPISSIPPFAGRICKTPPPVENGWTVPSYWPPPRIPYHQSFARPDIAPSRDEPLEIQIQAYALRWGFWATQVNDEKRRGELLNSISDKMQQAWENAIANKIYPHPDASKFDLSYRKGRKRDLSPSRQPIGFTSDGKDKYAITCGELEQTGITMEEINSIIESEDFEDGELFLDGILARLNRAIQIRDWSANPYVGSVVNRNLLMYCLWVVQQSRSSIKKMTWLLPRFQKDQQKRNTECRMEIEAERVKQHLALAMLLKSKKSYDTDQYEDSSEEETEQNESQHEEDGASRDRVLEISQNSVIDSVDHHSLAQPGGIYQIIPLRTLTSMAQAVLAAQNLNDLRYIFESQGVSKQDLDPKMTESYPYNQQKETTVIRSQLYAILDGIGKINDLEKKLNEDSQSEDIVQLTEQRDRARLHILQHQNVLRDALDRPAEIEAFEQSESENLNHFIDATDRADESWVNNHDEELFPNTYQNTGDMHDATRLEEDNDFPTSDRTHTLEVDRGCDQDHLHRQQDYTPQLAQTSDGQPQNGADTDYNMRKTPINKQVNAFTNMTEDRQSHVGTEGERVRSTSQTSPSFQNQGSNASQNVLVEDEKVLKQKYTDEIWLPRVNNLLLQHNRPPLRPGQLNKWQGIKEILSNLGTNQSIRNRCLRDFKAHYELWLGRQSDQLKMNAVLQHEWTDPWSQKTNSSSSLESSRINEDSVSPTGQPLLTTIAPSSIMLRFPNRRSESPKTTIINGRPSLLLRLPDPRNNPENVGEYESAVVRHTADGLAYRFSPYGTVQQRKTIDKRIQQYSRMIAKYQETQPKGLSEIQGSFVSFCNPDARRANDKLLDDKGLEIAFGFWDLGHSVNALRPIHGYDADWFFQGREKPMNWGTKVTTITSKNDDDEEENRVRTAPLRRGGLKRNRDMNPTSSTGSGRATKKRRLGVSFALPSFTGDEDEDEDDEYVP